MLIWFDTEFIEDAATIDLLSIGMIREDGEELYLESSEADPSKASPWVVENVLPHLSGVQISRREMAAKIVEFAGSSPQFWADYASYDWVALCQLFGTMMDLPTGWPMFVRDLQQLYQDKGRPYVPISQEGDHNALEDARRLKATWAFLREV